MCIFQTLEMLTIIYLLLRLCMTLNQSTPEVPCTFIMASNVDSAEIEMESGLASLSGAHQDTSEMESDQTNPAAVKPGCNRQF